MNAYFADPELWVLTLISLLISVALWLRAAAATHSTQGMSRLGEGRVEEASRDFERARVRWPWDPGAHFGRGLVLQKRGAFPEAERALERALKLASDASEKALVQESLLELQRAQGRSGDRDPSASL